MSTTVWLIIGGILVLAYLGSKNTLNKVKQKKKEYDEALNGNSKIIALQKGREYYGLSKNITAEIELRIANDINVRENLK